MKLALLLAAGAAAAPSAIQPRKIDDSIILNYALTLEHLEDNFYREGVAKFGAAALMKAGYSSKLPSNLGEISKDESTHVAFLTEAIKKAGYKPVAACTYDFGMTTAEDFVKTASLLEGIGVTAYLGAAQYISNPDYLTAAGSILTVEARHSSYLRDDQVPPQSPFPQSFDVPLDFDQVYTLASLFIKSCPASNPKLPVKAFPYVTIAKSGKGTHQPARAGQWVPFDVDTKVPSDVYGAWMTVTGPIIKKAKVINPHKVEVYVPEGIAGQSYMVLTKSASKVTDANTVAGPAVVAVQAPYTIKSH